MSVTESKYLLTISIGPVQGFIAAARKTRDLWFGSYILSEISKAVARCITEKGNELIFPGIKSEKEIQENSDVSVANILLAVVSGDPNATAQIAKEAARDYWKKIADTVMSKKAEIIKQEIWNAQIDDVVEFYAAWVPLTNNYVHSRERVMRLLAGRKNCREFKPSLVQNGFGIPKSSLDGARESVLNKDKAVRDFQIKSNEHLDAVGLVKRFGAKGEQTTFPSVLKFALDPLQRSCNFFEDNDWKTLCESDNFAEWKKDNQEFGKYVDEHGLYYAVLHADGDKMGAAIASRNAPQEHREFSQQLAGFAAAVPGIVEKNHGSCVYSGGDDVLAFLPVDTCLDCARELHDSFATNTNGGSLSVGIVIVHVHEMLETVLEFAREAERIAKRANDPQKPNDALRGDRDGLAIQFHARGNDCVTVREQWGDNENAIDKRLKTFADDFSQKMIPMKYPYDLRQFFDFYQNAREVDFETVCKDLIRMSKKKEVNSEMLEKLKVFINAMHSAEDIRRFSEEMLIAQVIGEAIESAKPKAEVNHD